MHLDPDDAIAGQHVPGLERPPLRHLVAKSRLRQAGVLLLRDQGAKELFLDQLDDIGLLLSLLFIKLFFYLGDRVP